MKIFGVLLLIGLATSVPLVKRETASDEDGPIIVKEEFFPDQLAIYTSKHDIVNLIVPMNELNTLFSVGDDDSDDDTKVFLFFVEADKKDNGKVIYKGLYTLFDQKSVMILENGVDVAVSVGGNTSDAYIAATDGLYKYDKVQKKALKYGALTDNFISIAKLRGSDVIYAVSDKKKLYKITDNGNKMTPVIEVQNVVEIVVDMSDNLYFYGDDKQVYVLGEDGVKKIEGLPKNENFVKLLKAPVMVPHGVLVIVNDRAYIIKANGTSEFSDVILETRPTAFAVEGTIVHYYAHNKKIYQYNLFELLIKNIFNQLENFFKDNKSRIQGMATQSRSLLSKDRQR